MEYRIPVDHIYDKLLSIEKNPEFLALKKELKKIVNDNIEPRDRVGEDFKVTFDLGKGWYPVFTIENQWVAADFVQLLIKKYGKARAERSLQRAALVSDNDGNQYLIPASEKKEFISSLKKDVTLFEKKFGHRRVDGDFEMFAHFAIS